MGCFQKATIALIIALHLLSGLAKRENKHRRRDIEQLELLEGAENGRYKVVAKAEPYKNLPPAPVTPGDFFAATPAPPKEDKLAYVTSSHRLNPSCKTNCHFLMLISGNMSQHLPMKN